MSLPPHCVSRCRDGLLCDPPETWRALTGPDHRLLLPSGGGSLHDGELLAGGVPPRSSPIHGPAIVCSETIQEVSCPNTEVSVVTYTTTLAERTDGHTWSHSDHLNYILTEVYSLPESVGYAQYCINCVLCTWFVHKSCAQYTWRLLYHKQYVFYDALAVGRSCTIARCWLHVTCAISLTVNYLLSVEKMAYTPPTKERQILDEMALL